jgi:benzil reductase ((S)-benzoin forming)
MKHFFISGTSSGIGKAIAKKALERGHHVTGFSRRCTIEHSNYKHLNIDLSEVDSYLNINFNENKSATELILINNAGWLGDVKPVAHLGPEKVKRSFHINLIAPSILCKLFLEQTENNDQKRVVINISSGAANYAIPSWSTYCAAKAGINLFTEVMQQDHPDVRCYSIAPGIVDTEMQSEIRELQSNHFPDKQRFVEYKENGELASPEEVSTKIHHIVDNPQAAPSTTFSLRDVS